MGGTMVRRAILATALGMGVWAGLARADGPPANGQPVVIQGTMYTNPGAGPVVTEAPAGQRWLGQRLWSRTPREAAPNPKPHGCWTHFNDYTCSTWASEYAFIFGSCRNFFGEPCQKGPPPPLAPGVYPPKNIAPNCQKCNQP